MITLYGISTSRAGRCVWALEELGLDYDQVPLHFNDGSTRTLAYREINPNQRIPTLIDGDLVLYESMAINHYLANRYGGGLWPTTEIEASQALMWSFWCTNEIENLLRPLLRHRLFLPAPDRDSEQSRVAAEQLAQPLRILDDALAKREYLVGNRFGVADINVSHGMFWIPLAGVDLGDYSNLAAWLERLGERSSIQKVWGGPRPNMDTADERPRRELDPRRGF